MTHRPRITGLDGIAAYVTDFPAACAFYEDVLGLEKASDLGTHGRVYKLDGEQQLLVCGGKKTPAPGDRSAAHATFCLRTASIPELFADLKARGVSVHPDEPMALNDEDAWFSFLDPSGNVIEVVGPK